MTYELECKACGYKNDIVKNSCEQCGTASSHTPNVRRAIIPDELNTLSAYYKIAKSNLKMRKLTAEGIFFEHEVQNKGKAVININFSFLWQWLMHGHEYMGYRRLVFDGVRQKAKFIDDITRSIADAILFGSEIDIVYAALTLDGRGLTSYGPISVILQTKLIEKRTSMLDRNSYDFIRDAMANGWKLGDSLPAGHLSDWKNRKKLALIKCEPNIVKGLTDQQAARLVLYSEGQRNTDQFLELYVNGKLINSVVESINFPVSLLKELSEEEQDQYDELKRRFVVIEY